MYIKVQPLSFDGNFKLKKYRNMNIKKDPYKTSLLDNLKEIAAEICPSADPRYKALFANKKGVYKTSLAENIKEIFFEMFPTLDPRYKAFKAGK